jgi:hypothetical protein
MTIDHNVGVGGAVRRMEERGVSCQLDQNILGLSSARGFLPARLRNLAIVAVICLSSMTRRPGLDQLFDVIVPPVRRDPTVALLQQHNHFAELGFVDGEEAVLYVVSRQHCGAAAQ